MLIEMNLDEDLIAKIRKLLLTDQYASEKDVIIRAIENLYERTMATGTSADDPGRESQWSYYPESPDAGQKYARMNREKSVNEFYDLITHDEAGNPIVVELKGHTFRPRLDISLLHSILDKPITDSEGQVIDPGKHLCDVPKSEEIYGMPYTGLIWGFHNRFFPVKFIITALAKIMVEKKQPWIDFDDFRTEIRSEVMVLSKELGKMNFHHIVPLTGFPKTIQAFAEMPKLKKMGRNRRLEKAATLEITSNNRFLDQFVGRELTSKDVNRKVAGACFEMNLMKAGSWDEDSALQVTLTELGKEFLMLDYTETTDTYNPIYRQLFGLDELGTPIENIFSELEADFIIQNIIPKFELEDMVVKKFLTLSKNTSVDEIVDIFGDMQKEYLEEKNPEGYKDRQDYIKKNVGAMATTVMTRLVELGKVKRIKHGLHVSYIVNTS